MSGAVDTAVKDTAKHGLVYGAGVMAPRLVGFILLPIFARYLSPAEFGAWALLQSFSEVAGAFFSVGLDTACMRSFLEQEEGSLRARVVGSTVLLVCFSMGIFGLIAYPAAETVSLFLFKSSEYTFLLRLVIIPTALSMLSAIPLVVFRSQKKSKQYILIQSGSAIVRICLMSYLLIFASAGLVELVYVNIFLSIVVCSLLFFLIRKNISFKINIPEIKGLLSFGLPIMPGRMFYKAIRVADRYFISLFVSLSAVGIYSVGMKIGQIVTIFLGRPFQLIFPAMAFELDKESYSGEYYIKILTYYVYVGALLCLSVSIFSGDLLALMGKSEYLAAGSVIPVIALSCLLAGVQQNLQIGVFVERKTYWVAIVAASGCCCNLGLNWVLVRHMGIFGSALSLFLTRLLMVLMIYLISIKYKRVLYEWGRLCKIVFAACLLYGVSLLTHESTDLLPVLSRICLWSMFPIGLYFMNFYTQIEKDGLVRILRAPLKRLFSLSVR